jgi:hypothetical protein
MISTKNIKSFYKIPPSTRIFQKYLNVTEPFDGTTIKVTSIFNPSERTPSLCLFYSETVSDYLFKDFSSGLGGDGVKLVELFYGLDTNSAIERIKRDFENEVDVFVEIGETSTSKRYIVSEYKLRTFEDHDLDYWNKFGISKDTLEKYNVQAISEYMMSKKDGNHSIKFAGPFLYGYFKQDGTLYKIYQPLNNERKFIKVDEYLQGSEQIGNSKNLIITSSLKDIMTLSELFPDLDYIAPDSENTFIDENIMNTFLNKYEKIGVYFDSDKAGVCSMLNYQSRYNLPYIFFNLSKDPSDGVKMYGKTTMLIHLAPKFFNIFNETLYEIQCGHTTEKNLN